jgi:NodT family efflux transporter outer membrane factor (OMF) lipoprotein
MSGLLRWAASVSLATLLTGCAVAAPPKIELPEHFEGASDSAPSTVDLTRWWDRFNDPALSRLVDEALARSPDAKSALSVLKQARATRDSGLFGLLPQSSATISRSQSGASLSHLDTAATTTSVPVTWEVDLFKDPETLSVAGASFAQARFDFEASRASLAAQVADQVIQIEGLTQQLTEAKANIRISDELLRISKVKAERGLAATSDIASFESDRATAAATITQLQEQVRASRRTLLVLLGRGTESTNALDLAVPSLTPPVLPATLPGELISRRADVRRSAAALAVATGNLNIARLGFFPTLMVEPTYNTTKTAAGVWTLTTTVSQVLFNLPQTYSQVRIQSETSEQAFIAYRKTVQTAFGEAENAVAGYAADQDRLKDLADAERQARIAFEAEKARYDAGYSDQTALLQKEQVWRQARSSLTSLQISTLTDAVTAFKALGGGWSPSPSRTAS